MNAIFEVDRTWLTYNHRWSLCKWRWLCKWAGFGLCWLGVALIVLLKVDWCPIDIHSEWRHSLEGMLRDRREGSHGIPKNPQESRRTLKDPKEGGVIFFSLWIDAFWYKIEHCNVVSGSLLGFFWIFKDFLAFIRIFEDSRWDFSVIDPFSALNQRLLIESWMLWDPSGILVRILEDR